MKRVAGRANCICKTAWYKLRWNALPQHLILSFNIESILLVEERSIKLYEKVIFWLVGAYESRVFPDYVDLDSLGPTKFD